MDELSHFCRLNSRCPEHGKRGPGNPTVTSGYGPGKQQRMPKCRICKARFSERKGTPLFDSRIAPEKGESILEQIAEGLPRTSFAAIPGRNGRLRAAPGPG